MTDQEKWVEALARLTRKTWEGEIKWRSIPANQILEPESIGVDKAFETTFRDQRIRAFHTRRQQSVLTTVLLGRAHDRFVIEFLDTTGNPVYRPPLLDGAKDLFSAIEHQAAPVGDFIDALLSD